MACVYALVSSGEPDVVRYVGRTKPDSPERRLRDHKNDAKAGRKYHVHNWIRKVQEGGDTVITVTLESDLTWEESAKREIYWIAHYRSLGVDLTNMTSGGDGVLDLSPESKERARLKKLGKGHSQTTETRRKISETRKILNIKASDETKEKQRKAKLGKKVSAETKAKISASTINKPKSKATKAKMSAWQIGRVLSDEHKEKVSNTLKEYYSKESDRLPGGRKRK
jgi:hypothetical protein